MKLRDFKPLPAAHARMVPQALLPGRGQVFWQVEQPPINVYLAEDEVLLRLRRRSAMLLVPLPERLLSDCDFDIWGHVRLLLKAEARRRPRREGGSDTLIVQWEEPDHANG